MIRQFLDVSSGHLAEQTWAWLDKQLGQDIVRDPRNGAAAQLAGGITRYGWFVYAPEDPDPDLPQDLRAVLTIARERGAEYVLFDCDAVPNQDLPVLHPDFRQEPAGG